MMSNGDERHETAVTGDEPVVSSFDPTPSILYRCNECDEETVFSTGLCSDCQLWAGRSIPDIVHDFRTEIGA